MKIEFDEKAIKNLKNKEIKEITIDIKAFPTWGGMSYNPVVSLGRPKDDKEYTLVVEEEIDVYLNKDVNPETGLVRILYKKFAFMEKYIAMYY